MRIKTERTAAPAVTVVVPVRNPGGDLPELLAALAEQTIRRDAFEVIIGDDGSTDGSIDAVPREDGWVCVSSGPPLTSYAARNRAARLARAPVLAFCDADCRPEPQWLEKGLAALNDADLAAGEIRFIVPAERTVWTLLDVDMYLDQERTVTIGAAVTANLFVRRGTFHRVDGFDESLASGGDYDFVHRCIATGARLVHAREALIWHPTRDEAWPFLRQFWFKNWWTAVRIGRAGDRPRGVRLRSWVPLLRPMRSRRSFGRSLVLDRRRLRANGIEVSLSEHLRALPIMYLVLPYVGAVAELGGWLKGRRLAQAVEVKSPPAPAARHRGTTQR